jgi:hypothetical protein
MLPPFHVFISSPGIFAFATLLIAFSIPAAFLRHGHATLAEIHSCRCRAFGQTLSLIEPPVTPLISFIASMSAL